MRNMARNFLKQVLYPRAVPSVVILVQIWGEEVWVEGREEVFDFFGMDLVPT